MSDMDPKSLPNRCLVDTGVLIRALGQFQDEHAQVCRDFFDEMIVHDKRMLVAAPSIAEMLRGQPQPLPRTKCLVPVAFDSRAAELLGLEIPVDVLRSHSSATGHSRTYLKYDAMIVACAKRWEAECIVALDGDHGLLAQHVNVVVRHPREFLLEQVIIPFDRKARSE
jgi:predicted nucleic acid-binding protein